MSKALSSQHTHTHTHTHQVTRPTLLPSSLATLSRRVGQLMPPPERLNNASPRGERQTTRGLPHGDSCGVNKLQQWVLCSSKSKSTSLVSIRRSLSTKMGGPWGRCTGTSSRSYDQCGNSAVSCAWSGVIRMRSARTPLSTCEFCDARGTHVQVYLSLMWFKQALEPNFKTSCNMCANTQMQTPVPCFSANTQVQALQRRQEEPQNLPRRQRHGPWRRTPTTEGNDAS